MNPIAMVYPGHEDSPLVPPLKMIGTPRGDLGHTLYAWKQFEQCQWESTVGAIKRGNLGQLAYLGSEKHLR